MKKLGTYAMVTLLSLGIGTLPAAGVELNYGFVQDAVTTLRTTTNTTQVTARQGVGMPERATHTVVAQTTQRVQAVSPEGNGTVETRFDSINAQAQVGGQSYSWDSTSGNAPVYFFAPLAGLLDQPVTAVLTPKGQVLQISGLKNLQDAVLARTQLDMDMGYDVDQVASDVIQAAIAHLPDGDLAVNATWTNQATLPDPFSGGLNLNASYTYTGQETIQNYDCAKVNFSLTVRSIPRMLPNLVKVGGFATDVQVEMEASGNGNFWIAINEGIIVKYSCNMSVNATQTSVIEAMAGEKRVERYSTNTTIAETSDLVSYTTN